MTQHACPRCGLESSRERWWDRHPAAAVCTGVFVGLPTLYTLAGIILAYPWFFVPVLVIVCAFVIDRRMRRRAAISARAEWEYREEMVRAMQHQPGRPPTPPGAAQMRQAAWQPDGSAVRPRNPAPWHVVTQWPTQRFRRAQ